MIPLYTPVPHIATNNSDTERKNNRKSMRVIIYTVVKINSRPIGIGEREKVSSSTQEEKCTPGQTYSYKEPKLTGQNKLPTTDPSPLQSLLSKMAVDRQPFTLHSSVPQTDTTNSVIERIVARIATVPWVTNCGRLELVCAQKKILKLSQQHHETQTSIISLHIILPLTNIQPGPVDQNQENPSHHNRTKTAGCGSVTITTLERRRTANRHYELMEIRIARMWELYRVWVMMVNFRPLGNSQRANSAARAHRRGREWVIVCMRACVRGLTMRWAWEKPPACAELN